MDGLYGMRRSPFDRDWGNWVDSECRRTEWIECAIFFQSSSTIHYRWNWRREDDCWFQTSILCNAILTTEKSTKMIQNVERTHGTIHPSILFFPFLLNKSHSLLSFQSTVCPSPLSYRHFTPFTPFHTNTIPPPFYTYSTSFQPTCIPIHPQLPHHSFILLINSSIPMQHSQPLLCGVRHA